MKRLFSSLVLCVVAFVMISTGSLSIQIAKASDNGSTAHMKVTTITDDGNRVKGNPTITAVPATGETY